MEKLAEKFLLLALHPEKARYLIATQKLNVGLQASILMDLYFDEKVEFADKRVKLKSHKARSGSQEGRMLARIAKAKKPPRIKSVITNDSLKARKYRFMVFYDMQRKGLVKVENKKWWIFPYKLVTLSDQKQKSDLVKSLIDMINSRAKIAEHDIALLAIIKACKIERVLSNNPKERKEIRSRLKEITRENELSQSIEKALDELNAAIAATVAITASTAASS